MVKTGIVCASLLMCGGCATIVTGGGETQSVRFTSTPRGAKVYVDENYVGVTPTASSLTRKDDHFVRMEYGGQVKTEELHNGVNPWIFGNILLGGVIGIVVDGLSGAFMWPGAGGVDMEFSVTEVAIPETKLQKAPSTPPVAYPELKGSDGKPFRTNRD